MQTLWEKIVFWTKAIVFGLIALYALLVIAANWSSEVVEIHLIFTPVYYHVSLEKVLLVDSIVSIFGWWLFWAVYRTIRRIKAASEARAATNSPTIAPPSTTTTPESSANMPFTPPK